MLARATFTGSEASVLSQLDTFIANNPGVTIFDHVITPLLEREGGVSNRFIMNVLYDTNEERMVQEFDNTFSDWQPNATATSDIVIGTIPRGTVPEVDKIKHSAAFGGGLSTAVNIILRYGTPAVQQSSNLNAFVAPGDNVGAYKQNLGSNIEIMNQDSTTDIILRMFVTGDIVDNITSGVVKTWIISSPELR